MDKWSLQSIAREAWLNIFGHGSRLRLLLALSILLGIGVTAIGALDASGLRRDLRAIEEVGANVVTFRSADPSATIWISRNSCEALARNAGVLRAGLLIYGARVSITPVGVGLPVVRASTTLYPELSSADLLLGSMIGVSTDAHYFVKMDPSGGPVVASTVGSLPDVFGTNASVVSALQPGDQGGEQCLVVLDPRLDVRETQTNFAAQLAVVGGAVLPVMENVPALHPTVRFEHRITAYVPLALGAGGGLACALAFRFRSTELATYRLSGTGRRSLLLILGCEIALIAGVGLASAVLAGVTLSAYALSVSYQVEAALSFGLAWMLCGVLGTAQLAWVSPIALAKDR